MMKPEFLYHGGRKREEILTPKQAVGFGGSADCQNAIYAVAVREWAIPFAIPFMPTAPDAMFSVDTGCSPPRIRLTNTEVLWNETGYLYTLPAETFVQIDDQQWVSYSSLIPVLVEEIDPVEFKAWIEFQNT